MSNKDVHKTGALGAILGNKGLLTAEEILTSKKKSDALKKTETYNALFDKKNAVLSSDELSLIKINTKDCFPWAYANRSKEELGDLQALSESLKHEGQQEPILVRLSKNKNYKYDVIFGRRRYEAAIIANIPLIAICKTLTDQEAALAQKAENTNRESVSGYSEAIHYKILLDNHCFKSEAELSRKLNIPKATLSNLLSFTKIPKSITEKIPNIHNISIRMAVAIVTFINKSDQYVLIIEKIAEQIGEKITSAKQLKIAIEQTTKFKNKDDTNKEKEIFADSRGNKLMTVETSKNSSSIKLTKSLLSKVDINLIKDVIMKLYEDT